MTVAERVNVGAALWEAGHSLQQTTMRQRFPEADSKEIAFQIAVTRFGADLARKAYRRG
jgi:hypothetical protein